MRDFRRLIAYIDIIVNSVTTNLVILCFDNKTRVAEMRMLKKEIIMSNERSV